MYKANISHVTEVGLYAELELRASVATPHSSFKDYDYTCSLEKLDKIDVLTIASVR